MKAKPFSKNSGRMRTRFPRKISLRLVLISTVIICWLIPMVLIITAVSGYVFQNMRTQLDDSLYKTVQNSADMSTRALQSVINASRAISYDDKLEENYAAYRSQQNRQVFYDDLTSLLRKEYQNDANIAFSLVYLIDEPENFYYVQNPLYERSYESIQNYITNVHPSVLQRSENLGLDFGFINYNDEMYMFRNIANKKYDPYAVIVLKLNMKQIFASFENGLFSSDSFVYLNGTSAVVQANGKGGTAPAAPYGLSLAPAEQRRVENNNTYTIYGRQKLDRLEFYYAVEIDREGLYSIPREFYQISLIIVLLIIPFMLIAIWFFYENIFQPMQKLSDAAKIMQEGNLGYQMSGEMKNTEFAALQDSFNSMSSRLKSQFEQIYSEELALRDARIMALQSQINPHFLNNTLEIINWEARLAGNDKISGMIEALSLMLDAAMDRKSSPLISLQQELSYIDAYIFIVRERFGKRLRVKKSIEPETLDIKVPRLIMQPIVENSVEHGITPQQTCNVEIKAFTHNDFMYIKIENNVPMTDKDKQRVSQLLNNDAPPGRESSLHLGIRNVNTRLKMIYGESAGLEIYNKHNRTVSKISIPLTDDFKLI